VLERCAKGLGEAGIRTREGGLPPATESPRVRALVSCYLALPACRKSTADLLVAANHAGTESRHHPPHRHNGILGPPVAAAPPALRDSASRPNRGPVHW
jgi:hypothetical protein